MEGIPELQNIVKLTARSDIDSITQPKERRPMETHSTPAFGLSLGYMLDAPSREIVEKLGEFGFTAGELNIRHLDFPESELRILSDGLDRLTFHLPFDAQHRLVQPDPAQDAAVVEKLRALITRACELGVRTFVLHMMNLSGQRIEEYWDRSVQVARAVGQIAREHDSVIGCENCYPVVRYGPVTERFLSEVDDPAVGMTLDTGHFWSAVIEDEFGHGKEWPLWNTTEGVSELNALLYEMARSVPHRITNIHIHNLRPSDWKDHQPVGEGIMEYDEFFEILDDAGYDRTLMVEIRNPTGDWAAFESSARYLQQFMPETGRV